MVRDLSVCVGSDGTCLLVQVGHDFDSFLAPERIVEVHCCTARDEEDVLDAAVAKKPHQVVRELQAITSFGYLGMPGMPPLGKPAAHGHGLEQSMVSTAH